MKRKTALRVSAALLSAGFVMSTVNGSADRIASAEELKILEDGEELVDTESEILEEQEVTEPQSLDEKSDNQDAEESETDMLIEETEVYLEEETETSQEEETEILLEEETETSPEEETELPLEDVMEIQLPQKSVQVRTSDFLPVQGGETGILLKLYEDVYLLHIKSEQGKVNTFYFNQPLKDSDIAVYYFDSENNTAAEDASVQNDISLGEDGSVLSLNLKDISEYVLVISHGSNYDNLAYMLKNEDAQPDETESEVTTESETEPESESASEPESEATSELETEPESETASESGTESEVTSEPETETESETASEPETEPKSEVASESETEAESETASESETQEATLVSVRLNLDQDLKTVPTVFSEYLDNLDTYTVTLVYSDGSESILDRADKRYTLSVHYEDAKQDEGTIRRIYYATVEEHSTGNQFEDTQYTDLGKEEPVEIKTEEMTSVILEGKKKWIIVQSTPTITGRYAMNSNKMIENIYYVSDDGQVVCAEDAFQLQEGRTYQFLIELK